MKTRYIRGDLVRVNTPARSVRYSDRRRHVVRVTHTTPKPVATREALRDNVWRNDGLRAHSDTFARLYA